MPYELSLFRHILQGDLSPLYFSLETSEQTSWYDHLSEVPAFCTKQVHVQFNQSGNALSSIHSLRVQLLDQHLVPIFVAQDHAVHPNESVDGESLLSHVLDHLSLDKEAVIEWYHWQDERAQLHLELFAQYPIESLSPEEQRYHFYQCLLNEQIDLIQEGMVQYVHQTASRKKVTKYVQDHQRDLLTYASQVLHYLDEEQPQVYTRSDAYTLPDVYKLIFLSLEELTDYVEQQFSQYLDATAPVPYHYQVVYASRLVPQLSALLTSLSHAVLDTQLIAVLEETIEGLRQLPAPKATHSQLRYYHQLIQTLETLAEDNLSSESLTTALFRINFNHPAFVRWFTEQIQDQLASCVTVEERLPTLYRYRKFCKQSLSLSSLSYQPEQLSIQEQALSWINEEIVYQQEVGDAPEATGRKQLPRIKTNLSVPELSLFIRTLFEVDVLVNQKKKAHVYRHFSQIFDSVQQENISYNKLRDSQYRPDRHTIASLKGKVIDMMNFLNSL